MSEGKRKYRQRLLRQVRVTKSANLAREILTHSRYRKAFLLEEYLARCDRLISTVPSEALDLARQAPDYARLTALEEGNEDRSWEARAWAVLGSAFRAMGQYGDAEAAFKRAIELRGNADEFHSLIGRLAVLRTEQRRYEEAISLADKTVAYFEQRYQPGRTTQEKDSYSLASALAIRGFTRCQAYYQGEDLDINRATLDYINALSVCSSRTPRTRLNCLKSLTSLLSLGWVGNNHNLRLSPSEIDKTFDKLLKRIKETDGRKSVSFAQALWIRATARARVGGAMMVPRAECLFLESRELFIQLEQWENFAHISVEIAWWYMQAGEVTKARCVLVPLLAHDVSRNYPAHWLSAIEAWVNTETLEAAVAAVGSIRNCKISTPKREELTDHRLW